MKYDTIPMGKEGVKTKEALEYCEKWNIDPSISDTLWIDRDGFLCVDTGGYLFKPGDKVSWVRTWNGLARKTKERIGTIIGWDEFDPSLQYKVWFEDGYWRWINQSDLTLVKKATPHNVVGKY